MSGVRSRVLVLSALVAVLAAAVPPTASAATIRRTWTATISGASAGADASGTGVLVRYWAGNGRFSTTLDGLSPSATYAVTVNQGTCSKPVLLLRLPNLKADTNGHAAASRPVSATRMAPVWRRTADGSAIVLRIRAGADVHCAPLTFPVATRVAVPGVGIDLPVVLQRGNAFPWCNVAMYLTGAVAARRGRRRRSSTPTPGPACSSRCSTPRSSTTAPGWSG